MKTEQEWLEYVTKYIENDEYKRAISWHIRLDLEDSLGYSTAKINYELNKLCKKGLLVKKISVYCIEYKLPE